MLPIIQGFVQMEHCVIGTDEFSLALVSRRSRFRAGTRYFEMNFDLSTFALINLKSKPGTSVVVLMKMDMLQITWKQNKSYHLANTKWHSINYVVQFRFIGANQDINIVHHRV